MKKFKKILSLVMAICVSSSMLVSLNVSAADDSKVYVMHTVKDPEITLDNGRVWKMSLNDGGQFADEWCGANLSYSETEYILTMRIENQKLYPVVYTLPKAFVASDWKYGAIVHKYEIDHTSPSFNWNLGDASINKAYSETPKWEKDVFAVSGLTDMAAGGTFVSWAIQGASSNVVADYSFKYLAFFKDEASALAYDRSITEYSINGIAGEVDNIDHTITFNMEGADSSAFANAAPVMTTDPLATVTCVTETIDYVNDIIYNVTNVNGQELQYTVKFNYTEEEIPEGTFVLKFDSAYKVANTSFDKYYYDIKQEWTKAPSYNATDKAVEITELGYNRNAAVVINKQIPDINKYKYAKIEYKYENILGNSMHATNGISFNTTTNVGVPIRDKFYLQLLDGIVYNPKWLTDIVDISSETNGLENADVIRFCAFDDVLNRNHKQLVTLKIRYIALFENYADAVAYDSDKTFTKPALELVRTSELSSSVDYTEDRGNPMFFIALYKDGKLLDLSRAAAPTYEKDAGALRNDLWGEVSRTDPQQEWALNSKLETTLSTTLDLASYDAGVYTAKALLLSGNSFAPYCEADEYSVTIAVRGENKVYKIEKVAN